jgi:hypothetical protein
MVFTSLAKIAQAQLIAIDEERPAFHTKDLPTRSAAASTERSGSGDE